MTCGSILKICSLKGMPAFRECTPKIPVQKCSVHTVLLQKPEVRAGSMRSAIADVTALIRNGPYGRWSLNPKADSYIQRGQRINKFSNGWP